jgi:FlaA1/EpsC-like NDP-sugar epimerase
LGKVLIRRLLSAEMGTPKQIIVFSRDEAKQHYMRLEYQNRNVAIDDFIYRNFEALVTFRIGDVRDYHSIGSALPDVDIIINAAALKQVPTCEYFPQEAVMTNIHGPLNIERAIREHRLPVETVIGVSTDKACNPVNVMGMTKALQERVFIRANLECPQTRFACVRYGNVLASRGSIIPLFHEQIRNGGPVTITDENMTRFFLSLNSAVDTIFEAVKGGQKGETYVPNLPSIKIIDLAKALIGKREIAIESIGIRPGEKMHEVLISEEEAHRTVLCGDYLVIRPMLPELLAEERNGEVLQRAYSSSTNLMVGIDIDNMLKHHKVRVEDQLDLEKDLLI